MMDLLLLAGFLLSLYQDPVIVAFPELPIIDLFFLLDVSLLPFSVATYAVI